MDAAALEQRYVYQFNPTIADVEDLADRYFASWHGRDGDARHRRADLLVFDASGRIRTGYRFDDSI